MKKAIALVLAVCVIGMLFAGCGLDRGGENAVMETPGATADILPDVSPMPTMDPEDGIVTDEDGIIGDGDDLGTGTSTGSGTNTDTDVTTGSGTSTGAGASTGSGMGTGGSSAPHGIA